MSYIEGTDRRQEQLLPARLEDYVGAGAAVRVIDAWVESLDLDALGFGRAKPAATGRPGYAPQDLVKLYLYGYLNQVRSSRRLEAEGLRNLEVMWLLRELRPDHRTIADFRKEHRAVFKPLFREFNLMCRKLELFGMELVAIDGAKFKAVNSPSRHFTAEELQAALARIDQKIDAYLGQLDQADQANAGLPEAPDRQQLQSKLQWLREQKAANEQRQKTLEQSGAKEVSETDPDSRGQKKVGVGYNAQLAVDAKHHLIVEHEVVQSANDRGELHAMAKATQEQCGKEVNVVADSGYHESDQLERCQHDGITTYVAPMPGHKQVTGYPKARFHYDSTQDCYRCPHGQVLTRRHSGRDKRKHCHYYYNPAACAACPLRAQCTQAKYRRIARLHNEAVLEAQAQRMRANPEMMLRRKSTVEHVFGFMRNGGHDRFLCRRLAMVRAELSLSSLAYNLRRAINLLGVGPLLAKMAALAA